jgi:PAS domain S-box-containing protein
MTKPQPQQESDANENLFAEFFQNSTDLMCICDLNGYARAVNPAWEEVLGYTAEEILARPLAEFIHPEDRLATAVVTAHVRRGQDRIEVQNRYIAKDGSARWLGWLGTVDRAKNVIYLTARDITEKIQLEEKLSSLTENIPGMIYQYILRPDGSMGFTYASHGVRELYELEPWLLLENRPDSATKVVEEDWEGFHQAVLASAHSSNAFRWEGRVHLASGKIKWIEAASRPNRQKDGSTLWDGVILDITAKREAEISLESERARAIASAKMVSLGEMAASIAHEINNPLSVIVGRIQQLSLLAESKNLAKEKLLEGLEGIESMSNRIARIIRGLRAFARDGMNDPFETKSIQQIVDETIELCQARFRHHEIKLNLELSSVPILIECRPVQISQILLNLLNNSFDAVVGRPEAWVRLECRDQGESVQLRISDSGPAISPGVSAQMMQPFFTTKEIGKGTGLGLSISRGIASSHLGSLTFDPKSKNTTFILTLPKKQSRSTRTL